jgi:hypothetical protein
VKAQLLALKLDSTIEEIAKIAYTTWNVLSP